jgi:UDP-glucuronate decarboxylase
MLMESETSVTGPCNLGNPYEVTVKDVAERILAHIGSRSPLDRRPLPQDDPKRRRPAIGRAMELLGWQPRVPLDTGLKATIGYFSMKMAAVRAPRTISPREPSGLMH